MKTSPPKIEAAILCENPFEWTLSLSIAGEREIAFFALQPKGTFGVTATVIAEPGHKNVAWSLPGNSVGRSLLILAADVEGNAAKVVVDVAQTHCGAQPSPQ